MVSATERTAWEKHAQPRHPPHTETREREAADNRDPMPAAARTYHLANRILKAVVGWTGFAGGCVLWGVSAVPVTIVLSRLFPRSAAPIRDAFNDVTRAGLRFYIRTLPFMRVIVDRPASTRDGAGRKACIMTVNHQSLLDPIMLMSIEPCLSGPAKAYLFRWPGLGAFLRLANFYESDDKGRDLMATMRAGVERAIEHGSAVLFFPEGTRSRNGDMGNFHRGAFRMAIEYGLPIQPVVIDGIHDVLPPGAILVRTSEILDVRVSYLDPIDVPVAPKNARRAARALADEVHTRMSAELARLRAQRRSAESRP